MACGMTKEHKGTWAGGTAQRDLFTVSLAELNAMVTKDAYNEICLARQLPSLAPREPRIINWFPLYCNVIRVIH